MNYNELIINGYNGQRTMPLVSFFKQQAQIAKHDNFVEFADFFNGCKIVAGDWKRSITSWCDRKVKELDRRIYYWENFIEDNEAWANRVIANGGFYGDYENSLETHHRECEIDRAQKIRELEQKKEDWQYEKHSIEIYTDDYTIKRNGERRSFFDNTPILPYITLEYSTLVSIENGILQAEQKLTAPDKVKNTASQQITIQNIILNELQKQGFIENDTARPLKWLKNKQLLRELLTHDRIKGALSIAEIERQTPSLFIDKHDNTIKLAKNKTVPNTDSDTLQHILTSF